MAVCKCGAFRVNAMAEDKRLGNRSLFVILDDLRREGKTLDQVVAIVHEMFPRLCVDQIKGVAQITGL